MDNPAVALAAQTPPNLVGAFVAFTCVILLAIVISHAMLLWRIKRAGPVLKATNQFALDARNEVQTLKGRQVHTNEELKEVRSDLAYLKDVLNAFASHTANAFQKLPSDEKNQARYEALRNAMRTQPAGLTLLHEQIESLAKGCADLQTKILDHIVKTWVALDGISKVLENLVGMIEAVNDIRRRLQDAGVERRELAKRLEDLHTEEGARFHVINGRLCQILRPSESEDPRAKPTIHTILTGMQDSLDNVPSKTVFVESYNAMRDSIKDLADEVQMVKKYVEDPPPPQTNPMQAQTTEFNALHLHKIHDMHEKITALYKCRNLMSPVQPLPKENETPKAIQPLSLACTQCGTKLTVYGDYKGVIRCPNCEHYMIGVEDGPSIAETYIDNREVRKL